VPGILRLTRDPDPHVRRTAVNALAGVGGLKARNALLEVSGNNPDPVIRGWAKVLIRRLDRAASGAPGSPVDPH
jgi:HEAT repeat protein